MLTTLKLYTKTWNSFKYWAILLYCCIVNPVLDADPPHYLFVLKIMLSTIYCEYLRHYGLRLTHPHISRRFSPCKMWPSYCSTFHNFSIFRIMGEFACHNLWRSPITHYYRVSINFTFPYLEITTFPCQNLRKSQDTICQKSRKFERLIKIKNKFTFSGNFFRKWTVFNTFDWTCCHSLKTRVALLSLPCN